MRELRLGDSGKDVADMRGRLGLRSGDVFDAVFAGRVKRWKWRFGFHRSKVDGSVLGLRAQRLLLGTEKRVPIEVVRARYRAGLEKLQAKRLVIVPRAAWGARPPKSPNGFVAWNDPVLWVHYTAQPAPAATRAAEMEQLRSIQAFHMGPSRDWNDIGYGFLIGPSGTVYEGRGMNRMAAHCPGHNHEPSVCVMVGVGEEPTAAQIRSVELLKRRLGKQVLKPHAAGFSTACPGPAVRKALGI